MKKIKHQKHSFIVWLFTFLCSFSVLSNDHLVGNACHPDFISLLFFRQSEPILAIDTDSLQTVDQLGGGVYYREIDAIIPLFPSLVIEQWLQYKNRIADRIGSIEPVAESGSDLGWNNSATTIDELILDAYQAAPQFKEMCMILSEKGGANINFGIKNLHMIKSYQSIEHKAFEKMKKGLSFDQSVGQIKDALRATMIVEAPEDIQPLTEVLKEYASLLERKFVFVNLWKENRSSGYVAVHAKMLFPIHDEKGNYLKRDIMVEIQIHLKCIMDGNENCVKERAKRLCHQLRTRQITLKNESAASTLLYLSALKKCPKNNHSHFSNSAFKQ